MIIPNKHINSDGDVVFELTHLSQNPKERKKGIFDCQEYRNWITVNPITSEVIKYECECFDFHTNRFGESPCKHIRESIILLANYNISYVCTQKGNI